jgi:hypothetical protein
MLLLVDYSSLLYRAFHSIPSSVAVNGVHGFLSMLARLVTDRRPSALAVAVDEDWRPDFRVSALPSYKAHRVAGPDDEADPVAPQEAVGREVLRALGICVAGAEGFEAEDVIATIAARTRGPIEIASGDRDLFALVRDPVVKVLYPVRGVSTLVEVDEAEIHRRYGIPGRAYGDFALLRGDPSDGLPASPASARRRPRRWSPATARSTRCWRRRISPLRSPAACTTRGTTWPPHGAWCSPWPTCPCRRSISRSRNGPPTCGRSPDWCPSSRSPDP